MALLGKSRTGRRSTFVLIVALLMMVGVVAAAGAAPAPKVAVCHSTSGTPGYVLINISENAFQAHVDHGDASPGEAVPGMFGYFFDAECLPIPADAFGDVYWTSASGLPGIHTWFTLFEGATDLDGYGQVRQDVPGGANRTITVACVRIDGDEVNWGGEVTGSSVSGEIGDPMIGWAKDGATDMIGSWFGGFPGNPDACSNAALIWNGGGTVTSGDLVVN